MCDRDIEAKREFQELIHGKSVNYVLMTSEDGAIFIKEIVFMDGVILKIGENGRVDMGDIQDQMTAGERELFYGSEVPDPLRPFDPRKGFVIYPYGESDDEWAQSARIADLERDRLESGRLTGNLKE